MTDTANTQKLASAETFDARLKSLDEPRWLAARYAPAAERRRLVAAWLLRNELHRALNASEPMLGKIRLQWWRESVESATGPSPRRHDLTEELAAILNEAPGLLGPMLELIDRHDDILDDHLAAGGHMPGDDHEQRHIDAEAASWRLAGLSLLPDATGSQLEPLTKLASAAVAIRGELGSSDDLWSAARASARHMPGVLWPAAAHIVAVSPHGPSPGPTGLRLRIFRAVLTRRI